MSDRGAVERVFRDGDRSFYYERGHRVYLDGGREADSPPKTKMPSQSYLVCNQCGLWRKDTRTFGLRAFLDAESYDCHFFQEYHLRLCQRSLNHEDHEAHLPPPYPVDKEWRPEICAEYVTHENACRRNHSDLPNRIVGTWIVQTEEIFQSDTETFVFDNRCTGWYWDWKGVDPPLIQFVWQVDAKGSLCLQALGVSAPKLPEIFAAGENKFELITYTPPYRASQDILIIYGLDDRFLVLRKRESNPKKETGPAWDDENPQDGIQVSRLTGDYLRGFYGSLFWYKRMLNRQLGSIDFTARLQRPMRIPLEPAVEWMMMDRLVWWFPHLSAKDPIRLAALLVGTSPRYCNSRLIGVDPRKATSLLHPPLKSFQREHLRDESPPVPLPPGFSWNVWECVTRDGTPASFLEASLLRLYTNELVTGDIRKVGILIDQDNAAFIGSEASVPSELRVGRDARPTVSQVQRASQCPENLLPVESCGRHKIGADSFVFLEYFVASRTRVRGPDFHIMEIRRRREWFRGDTHLWAESDIVARRPLGGWAFETSSTKIVNYQEECGRTPESCRWEDRRRSLKLFLRHPTMGQGVLLPSRRDGVA
jgi:hypothetical protein